MKKAYAYYRKSIELDADKSIKNQKEIVREYAAEHNIEIIEEFEEVANSASIDREGLKTMLEKLKIHKDIDYILLHRFDRISRDVKHMGYIMTLLDSGKTRLHSVTEENDYEDDPTKLMLIMMKTYGATMERVAIVQRMQDGRERKRNKGGFLGGNTPFGYNAIYGSGKFHINESEIPVVQKVFELRDEKMTMAEIAKELNNLGFKTRKGCDFVPMTVQRIVKHRKLYEGEGEAPAILEVKKIEKLG